MKTTKYELVTNMRPWEILKAMDEGVQFYTKLDQAVDNSHYVKATSDDVFKLHPIFKIDPSTWRDRLDGTIDNAVLCWVYDDDINKGQHMLILRYDDSLTFPYLFLLNSPGGWKHAELVSLNDMAKVIFSTTLALSEQENQ